MIPARPPKLAADHIRELTRPFTTVEIVPNTIPNLVPWPTTNPDTNPAWRPHPDRPRILLPGTRLHPVRNPSLLDQLEQTVTGTQIANEGGASGSSYGSKPAGRVDVLALLRRIEDQSHELAVDLDIEPDDTMTKRGVNKRRRLPLRERLQHLAGAIGDKPNGRVRSWWASARVLTQHEGAPYTPPIACPQADCEVFGAVRVRFAERLASCVECHTVWADDSDDPSMTFGRLAMWCRWSLDHLKGQWHLVEDDTYDTILGYDESYDTRLGYRVVCVECEAERVGVAVRRDERQRAARAQRAADRTAA